MSDPAIRVLLVEDNPGDVGLVCAYLAEERDVSIELAHVDRLLEGIELLASAHIDVVLLDLNLPDSSGLDTLRQILEHSPNVPVVVLTGVEGIEQALQAVRGGATDYLFKGQMDGPLLVRAIRFAIERAACRRAVASLREAGVRYRALFEESPDGIVLFDVETCLPVEFNGTAYNRFGYSCDEFGRLRICDFLGCETSGQITACVSKILLEERLRYESQHRTKTGEIRHILLLTQPITLSGRPLLHCVFRDVTERKRAELALQESQQQFRALVETTSDWIWATDQNGVYTYVSPKVKDLLGYDPEEVIGKTPFDLMPPDEVRCVAPLFRKIVEGREPIERLENVNLHKDGRPVVLETSGVPIFDANGGLVGYHGIDRDITVIKDAQESLRQREQSYQELLTAVKSYAYCVTVENGLAGAIKHSEGCVALTGYRPEDYDSDPGLWISLIHPDHREMVTQYVARVLAGDRLSPIEHRIFRRDGTVRWVRNTMVPYRESGTLVRCDGLIEDVTELRNAQGALRDKELQLLAAQKIQEGLLPRAAPTLPGFDIAGALCPAEFAAGDLFDYLSMGDGGTAVVIGDVTGHGFGPALIMAATHVALRLLVETHTDVDEILTLVNYLLFNETEDDRFVTLLLAHLNPRTRTLVYSNAGHPPGYVFDSSGEIRVCLETTDLPLGIAPDVKFSASDPLALESGDTVLLLSDGILESRSPEGEFFGNERALDVVRANLHRTAREIVEILCQAARGFAEDKVPADDTTAVVIKVKPDSTTS